MLLFKTMNQQGTTTEQKTDLVLADEQSDVLDIAPITRIGVETELSKYPIHNLAKRGKVDIQITKRRPDGQIDLKWEVSYSERYGQARQLAYKLDTIIVNQRIDETERPLPRLIKMGSLAEICRDLALAESGRNKLIIKKGLLQNASAFITAKLKYRTNDGGEETLEAGFTRYNIVFTGEKLPNGGIADAVYLILNEPYRGVLNKAPIRPLNFDYLKSLSPASQRFYEIISSRIYATLKNKNPFARILYSEFCTYSALTHHVDYENFRVQMAKIHRPHLKSGYIAKTHYENATDEQGNLDWMMCYKPGPRAQAEYMTFARKSKRAAEAAALSVASQAEIELTEHETGESVPAFALPVESRPQESKHPLHDELTKRGITDTRAKKILKALREGQQVLDQLEWGDHLIASEPQKIKSPSGFYVYLLAENVGVPPSFETSRKRQARTQAQATAQEQQLKQMELETAYEQYRSGEVDRFIEAHLSQAEVDEISNRKRGEIEETFKSFRLMNQGAQHAMLWGAVKAEIRPRVPILSFEEFSKNQSAQMSLFATSGAPSHNMGSESKQEQAPIAPKLAQGEPKPPRRGQGSHPAKIAPLKANFEATEVSARTEAKAVLPVEQRTAAAVTPITAGERTPEPTDGQLGIEESVLTARYQAFRQKEARRSLDQLGMMERGRRLKALRVHLLNEHPDKDVFQHLIAEGEYEKFHELSEQHLIEVTLEGLNLPTFEDWKRYALSVMGR